MHRRRRPQSELASDSHLSAPRRIGPAAPAPSPAAHAFTYHVHSQCVQSGRDQSVLSPADTWADTPVVEDCEAMTSHDRTAEFSSVVRSIKSRQLVGGGGAAAGPPSLPPPSGHSTPALQRHSEFLNIARLIGRDISSTYAKLEKLALLARRRSLFDDRPVEIQQLTHIISQDMANLNQQIRQLQQLSKHTAAAALSAAAAAGGGADRHVNSFSGNVVVALQSKLAAMSAKFKRVLELRTENLRSQRDRRDQFTCAGAGGATTAGAGGLMKGTSASSSGAVAGPPRSLLHTQGSVLLADDALARRNLHQQRQQQQQQHVELDMNGVRERHALTQQQQLHQQQQQQQQQLLLEHEQDSYYQSRSETMKGIETTIVELGSIFQQLAHMVKEQEEVVQRIDSNVEDASLNVESAHSEILKYFQSVSSNRWLMVKVFGVLLFFFLIFVLFMA